MADLTKLRIALCQARVREGCPRANERAVELLARRAEDAGAQVAFAADFDADAPVVVALGSSSAELAGYDAYDVPLLALSTEVGDFTVALGGVSAEADFAVLNDDGPWTFAEQDTPELAGPVAVVRPVGMRNSGKVVSLYDGGSFALDAAGRMVARLSDAFEEDLGVFSFGGAPACVQEPCADKLLCGISAGIRMFDGEVLPWKPTWVIGLSGGLDSCIVAALLAHALGAQRVAGYNLATRYNSDATKANAAGLAHALGIQLRNGSIEPVVQATDETVRAYGYADDAVSGLVLENVQARVRGHLLSTFAALEGGVVANNGNRVECALGYATLYGDAIGALAPIADLTKVQLFDLARQLNRAFGAEVIPENLLPQVTDAGISWQTMPSAELAEGQRDPMKWFYHDWLVECLLDGEGDGSLPADLDDAACSVMEAYVSDRLASTAASRWVAHYGLDDPQAFMDDLEWVLRQMRTASFKRIQAPPRLAVAPASLFMPAGEHQGACEPSERYQELRSALLDGVN